MQKVLVVLVIGVAHRWVQDVRFVFLLLLLGFFLPEIVVEHVVVVEGWNDIAILVNPRPMLRQHLLNLALERPFLNPFSSTTEPLNFFFTCLQRG